MGQMGPFGDLGPCQLNWNSVAIASLLEGATFRYTVGIADIREAEHGVFCVDAVFTGVEVAEFMAPFTRTTYANLSTLLPGSTRSGEGSVTGSGSGAVEVYSNLVGTTLFDLSQELIVKRIVGGVPSTDTTRWLHIVKTYPIPQFEMLYNFADGQRGFMVKFKVFPDANRLIWHAGAKFSA